MQYQYLGRVACVITCLFLLCGCFYQKKIELDLVKNLEIEVEGWDGKAKCSVASNDVEYSGEDEAVNRFIDSLTYQIKPSKNLSNGDVIKIKVTYSNDLLKLANVKILCKEKEFKVSGLHGEERKLKTEELEGGGIRISESIDGIDVPDYLTTDEEKQLYIEYMKSIGETKEECYPVEQWILGTGNVPTKRTDSDFLIVDYRNDPIDTYDHAFEFGNTSTQYFKIEMIIENNETIGWKVIFGDENG